MYTGKEESNPAGYNDDDAHDHDYHDNEDDHHAHHDNEDDHDYDDRNIKITNQR